MRLLKAAEILLEQGAISFRLSRQRGERHIGLIEILCLLTQLAELAFEFGLLATRGRIVGTQAVNHARHFLVNLVLQLGKLLTRGNEEGMIATVDRPVLRFEACRGRILATQISDGLRLQNIGQGVGCLLYTSPSPRDRTRSRMPSS